MAVSYRLYAHCSSSVPLLFTQSTKANHILMLATTGEASSAHVEPHIHRVLKEDSRRPPLVSRVRSLSIEAGARTSTNVAFKLGSRVLLHGTRLGQVVGFGPGINRSAETPLFTRRMYKLNRQRKFDQITEEDYQRGVIQQSFTSANTVIGATAGAIIGQVAIPVPVLVVLQWVGLWGPSAGTGLVGWKVGLSANLCEMVGFQLYPLS